MPAARQTATSRCSLLPRRGDSASWLCGGRVVQVLSRIGSGLAGHVHTATSKRPPNFPAYDTKRFARVVRTRFAALAIADQGDGAERDCIPIEPDRFGISGANCRRSNRCTAAAVFILAARSYLPSGIAARRPFSDVSSRSGPGGKDGDHGGTAFAGLACVTAVAGRAAAIRISRICVLLLDQSDLIGHSKDSGGLAMHFAGDFRFRGWRGIRGRFVR